MGTIIQPICTCNKKFPVLYYGSGFIYDENKKSKVPFACESCGEIYNRDVQKKHRCPKCKEQLTLVGEITDKANFTIDGKMIIEELNDDKIYSVGTGKYHCPSCKTNNVEFFTVGLWD